MATICGTLPRANKPPTLAILTYSCCEEKSDKEIVILTARHPGDTVKKVADIPPLNIKGGVKARTKMKPATTRLDTYGVETSMTHQTKLKSIRG